VPLWCNYYMKHHVRNRSASYFSSFLSGSPEFSDVFADSRDMPRGVASQPSDCVALFVNS